jgi:hypothetical protein
MIILAQVIEEMIVMRFTFIEIDINYLRDRFHRKTDKTDKKC